MSSRSLAHWLCAAVILLSAPFALRACGPAPIFGFQTPGLQAGATLRDEGPALIGAALVLGMLLAAGIVCLLPARRLVRAPWVPVAVWSACVVVPATATALAVAMLA